MRRRFSGLLCSGLLVLFLAGCGGSQGKYTRLEQEKQQLEQRMASLLREKEGLMAENQRLMALVEENEALRAKLESIKQSTPQTATGSAESFDADYK